MLRLSRKAILALEAVVDIASNSRPEPVQSKEITRRQGVPHRYLEQVMQALVRSGVLKGVRGPRGGYRLAKERRRISAGEIVRIVAELEIADEPPLAQSSPIGDLIVRPVVADVHDELMRRLDAISVEDLCRRAEEKGLAEPIGERADFAI
ncbi:MAG: Rrf2 family transcriptional regulator [Alphaproteobacteria bacterium]|nr:Rrf2 family transcriptional regulator [Alphaproteobacteria bacterium]